MFQVGDYVIYRSNGVCCIDAVGTLDLDNIPKDKMFYVLHPNSNPTGKIYAAVDTAEANMRKVLTKEEAIAMIEGIPEIEPMEAPFDKALEEKYKAAVRGFDSQSWIALMKCVYGRRELRLSQGKKMTAMDERYMKMAEDALYSELAFVLAIPKEKVVPFIKETLGDSQINSNRAF